MGPITDRTNEFLCPSDAAIVQLRRLLLGCLDDMAEGRAPRASGIDLDFRDVQAVNKVEDRRQAS